MRKWRSDTVSHSDRSSYPLTNIQYMFFRLNLVVLDLTQVHRTIQSCVTSGVVHSENVNMSMNYFLNNVNPYVHVRRKVNKVCTQSFTVPFCITTSWRMSVNFTRPVRTSTATKQKYLDLKPSEGQNEKKKQLVVEF